METIFNIDTVSDFEKIVEEILNNLYHGTNYSTYFVEENAITQAKHDLRNIIYNCNFNITNIKGVFEDKKMDHDKIDILISLLQNKKSFLLSEALTYYNSRHGEIIIDTEWLLKIILGTSELKTLKYSVLQVIFTTMDTKGEQKATFDVNRDILIKMIDTLQIICED